MIKKIYAYKMLPRLGFFYELHYFYLIRLDNRSINMDQIQIVF